MLNLEYLGRSRLCCRVNLTSLTVRNTHGLCTVNLIVFLIKYFYPLKVFTVLFEYCYLTFLIVIC